MFSVSRHFLRQGAALLRPAGTASLSTSTAAQSMLHDRLQELMPTEREKFTKLEAEFGNEVMCEVTVSQMLRGGRGIKYMLWEGSELDANEGIRFRGLTIPEVQKKFPHTAEGGEPRPESLLWLLLTGEVPTPEQEADVTAELHARSHVPDHVKQIVADFPKTMHPMTQFTSAVLTLQTDSVFAKAYFDGTSKADYWKATYEDMMNLIARLPTIASLIYRHTFHDGDVPDSDSSLDYSANFARMLGFNHPEFDELMRLYMTIHTDHEGGNASAHTTHLVGSTLADPYLSFAGGMCSLAGPLHGLANQEVLRFAMKLKDSLEEQGKPLTADSVREYAWSILNDHKVIPGFGHAVLRITDPRFTCQADFARKYNLNDNPYVQVVTLMNEVIPGVLEEHGKTANPFPNVDCHSGVLLVHYGLTEQQFYTVLFGVSRAIGVLSQLFWDRALGLPLERPKSHTMEAIRRICEAKKKA